MQKKISSIAILVIITLYADDTITVHNKTQDTIYARVYCVPAITRNQAESGALYQLPPAGSVNVTRPEKKPDCTRNLAFSCFASDLPAKMPKKAFEKLPSIGIGITDGKNDMYNFFVIKNRFGVLKGYNPLTWQAYQLSDDYHQTIEAKLVFFKDGRQDIAWIPMGKMINIGKQSDFD